MLEVKKLTNNPFCLKNEPKNLFSFSNTTRLWYAIKSLFQVMQWLRPYATVSISDYFLQAFITLDNKELGTGNETAFRTCCPLIRDCKCTVLRHLFIWTTYRKLSFKSPGIIQLGKGLGRAYKRTGVVLNVAFYSLLMSSKCRVMSSRSWRHPLLYPRENKVNAT